jgi:hypothetical protein
MRSLEIDLRIREVRHLFFAWRLFCLGWGKMRGRHPLGWDLLSQPLSIEIRVVLVCEPRDLHTVALFVFAWALGTQRLPRVYRHQSFTVKRIYCILYTIRYQRVKDYGVVLYHIRAVRLTAFR